MSQVDQIAEHLKQALFGRTVLLVEKLRDGSDVLVVTFDDGSALYLKYIYMDAKQAQEVGRDL